MFPTALSFLLKQAAVEPTTEMLQGTVTWVKLLLPTWMGYVGQSQENQLENVHIDVSSIG